MDNFDLKKFVSEKTLLNESAPGYDTRKQGEALPTLESVKAAYEAKMNIKEDESEFERNTPDRIDQLIILLSNAIPLADDLMEDENVGEMYDFAELSQQLENFINDLNLFSGN
jgi:hypothetical protein